MCDIHIALSAIHKSMLFVSRSALLTQCNLWKTCLPRIKPFYAVKSNMDPKLLEWIRLTGTMHVDCASPGEMRASLTAGFKPSDILYANTMKTAHDLAEAAVLGVTRTTTDSVEGVEQLAWLKANGREMTTIVRIAVDDRGSRSPFSIKFGAIEGEWGPIMAAIRKYKIPFGGVSFHVGSGSTDPEAVPRAIRRCRMFQKHVGADLPTVDIGGGFLPHRPLFERVAERISEEIDAWEYETTRPGEWIAEPGRFFSSPVQTLYCPIVFKKVSHDKVRYLLDDSVYGQFSGIVFDHAKPFWSVHREGGEPFLASNKPALFFGKTCDSLDLIAMQENAPQYQVGDIFIFPFMGAYTSASATTFNGFPLPNRVYLESDCINLPQHRMFKDVEPFGGVSFPIETKSQINLSL
jgi:ornithine decarboxylase